MLKEKLESMPDFKIEIDGAVLKQQAQDALDAIQKEKEKLNFSFYNFQYKRVIKSYFFNT